MKLWPTFGRSKKSSGAPSPTGPSRRSGTARRLAPLALVLVAILVISPLLATAYSGGDRPGAPVVTEPGVRGPSIVLTDPGTDPGVVAAENGIAIGFIYRNVANGFSADLSDADVAALQRDTNVESISIDRIVEATAFQSQISRIGADTAPATGIGQGGNHPEVGIAILDSGVGPNADLNIAGGTDCTGNGSYSDSGDHGTHVAGIAAARDNGDATTGIAPGARIYAVRVLTGTNGTLSTVICGLEWVANNAGGINVINLSLGLSQSAGPACGQSTTFPLRRAVCGVTARGIQVVVAAGNLATNANNYSPASYPEVISVSAYTDTNGRPGGGGGSCYGADDTFATYSNYAADVMAPGSCITSTAPGGGTIVKSGTSMASPLVAGALALYGSLSAITVPQSDARGLVSGAPTGESVLYLGNGSSGGAPTATTTPRTRPPRGTATPTRPATATPTRPATSTPTRSATATPTRQPGGTATPTRPPRTRSSPAAQSTATAVATQRPPRSRVAAQSVGEPTATTVTAPAARARAATATVTPTMTATVEPTATVTPTATTEPTATATTEPTATSEPTEEPTATLAPTEEPTATLEPTLEATREPTEEPTTEPTVEATVEPTLEPTLEPTQEPSATPTIAPAAVTDTFASGTAWYAVDDDPTTTWYMDVLAAVVPADAPVDPVDPTVGVSVGTDDGAVDVTTGGVPSEAPVTVVEPTAEPEDLALQFDLGFVQTVAGVRWNWTETTYAHGVEIQLSTDGETWTTVVWPDAYGELPGEWQEAAVGLDARFVRFLFPNAEQLPLVGGLNEVQILPLPAS